MSYEYNRLEGKLVDITTVTGELFVGVVLNVSFDAGGSRVYRMHLEGSNGHPTIINEKTISRIQLKKP